MSMTGNATLLPGLSFELPAFSICIIIAPPFRALISVIDPPLPSQLNQLKMTIAPLGLPFFQTGHLSSPLLALDRSLAVLDVTAD